MYDDMVRPQNIGHLMGVLPVGLFEDTEIYRARMDNAAADIKGVRRAPGVDTVFLPGERERIAMAERRANGIPIGVGVLAELEALGATYGLRL